VVEPALSGIGGADRLIAQTIIKGSLAQGIQSVMLIVAALAFAAAAAGALIPRSHTGVSRSRQPAWNLPPGWTGFDADAGHPKPDIPKDNCDHRSFAAH
jgi:hypothetical protein